MLTRGSSSRTVKALAVGDGRVGRVAQVDEEGLARLAESVAFDRDGDGLAGLAGGERQRAGGRLVIAAGRGRPVRRGEVGGHGLAARLREAEGGLGGRRLT